MPKTNPGQWLYYEVNLFWHITRGYILVKDLNFNYKIARSSYLKYKHIDKPYSLSRTWWLFQIGLPRRAGIDITHMGLNPEGVNIKSFWDVINTKEKTLSWFFSMFSISTTICKMKFYVRSYVEICGKHSISYIFYKLSFN